MECQHIICRWRRSIGLSSYFVIFLMSCVICVCYYLYKNDIGRYQFRDEISNTNFREKRIKENHSIRGVWTTITSIREGEDEFSDPFFQRTNHTQRGKTPTDNTQYKNTFIQRLAYDLQHKLESVIPNNTMDITGSCGVKLAQEKSCQKTGCLRLTLPKAPIDRITQLVEPPHLRVNEKDKEVLKMMGDSVPGYYDIILATAASSNHYGESKALLSNLHAYVFPNLKNFTLIYYDLGLTKAQRDNISQTCRCHVKDFPFSRFSQAFSILKCYTWKPVIVYAHASRCNILHWMDASVRFYEDPSRLKELYRLTRSRGLQTGASGNKTPRVTLQSMFHFFGEEPCSYHTFTQSTAASVIFHNEPLILEAVLTPWVACAINESCMCPHKEVDVTEAISCRNITYGNGQDYDYAQCHRFDQSALSIIVRKLFQEKSHHMLRPDFQSFFSIRRGHTTLIKTHTST